MDWRHRDPKALTAAIAALLVTGLSGSARAQIPATAFEALPTVVRVGETVFVTGSNAREVKGTLVQLSPSSLTILRDGAPVTFPSSEVATLRWREHDSLANGAVIGFGVGAGFALFAVAASCHHTYYYESCGGEALAAGLVYGAIGVGLGVAIDAMTPGKKILVYSRPVGSASARLSVAPLVSPSRQGIVVRFAF
jgi:hypothetical protein